MKRSALEVKTLKDIPNIGPAMIKDFAAIGVKTPDALKRNDAFTLYTNLCKVTGHRHDPCVLDTFMAAVDFMNGAKAKPWYAYTTARKKQYPNV